MPAPGHFPVIGLDEKPYWALEVKPNLKSNRNNQSGPDRNCRFMDSTKWNKNLSLIFMDNLTASEIAGFGVGTLLLCATIAAPKIDSFISSSQRSSLGMCKRCGDLKLIACSDCRGVGSVKSEGLIRSGVLVDLYESVFGEEPGGKTVACSKCRGRGHFPCRDCRE